MTGRRIDRRFAVMKAAAAGLALTCLPILDAFAQTTSADTTTGNSQRAATAEPEKQVCRRDTGSAETRIPKRVCRTQAEWDAIDKQNQEQAKRMTSQYSAGQNSH